MIKSTADSLKRHLPYVIGVVLIVLNALVDNNVLSLSDQFVNVLNAILAAGGLGILHHRQNA